jgi:hypothetical protein
MKSITGNLLKFAAFFALGSILFRYGLSWSITNHATVVMWIIAISYFIYNFSIGWYFGKKDFQSFPLHDIGFRFHLVCYLVFSVVGELWFLLNLQSRYENVKMVHLIVLFWGIFLVIHFILYLYSRKNTIKGLDKSQIFE